MRKIIYNPTKSSINNAKNFIKVTRNYVRQIILVIRELFWATVILVVTSLKWVEECVSNKDWGAKIDSKGLMK
jgi:hypothetical protein